jgi:hypothetical protein
MKKYKYTSATPCHTTLVIDEKTIHLSMYENGTYELPGQEQNPFVARLIAQGHLIELQTTKTNK